MADIIDSKQESLESKGFPGWRKRTEKRSDGGNTYTYISPSGETYTKGGFQNLIRTKRIQKTVEQDPTEVAADIQYSGNALEEDVVQWQSPAIEVKQKSLTKSSNEQATPSELTLTASMLLLVVTSLIAFFLRIPEAEMAPSESAAIATPIGNIVSSSNLNKKYGKYLRDSSDYVALGYSLYVYTHRVAVQVRSRREYEQRAGYNANTGAAGHLHPGAQSNVTQFPSIARGIAGANGATSTGSTEVGGASGGSSAGSDNRPLPATGGIAAKTTYNPGFNPIPKSN